MATSGSTNYSLTAREIATAALEMVGVVAIGETPPAADSTKALEQLNLMVKTWGADPEPKLWQITETSLAPIASTASYNLVTTPGARKVLEVRLRKTSTGIDTVMWPYSRQEYYEIPDKAGTGVPTVWWFDQQRASRTLYVWKVPTATIASDYTFRLSYLRVIEDLDSLSDDFDVPQEWLETLQYGLAARLAVPYDLFLTNPTKAAKIEERASALYAQLSAYDDEAASVFIQPHC